MSLITEALRRTRDASRPAGPPPLPVVAAPPIPAPIIPAGPSHHSPMRAVLVVLLVVVVMGAGYAGFRASRSTPVVAPPAPEPPAPVVVEDPPPPPVVEQPKPEPPPPPEPELAKPPRELPKLTLQGITHDKTGYEALINNWNVRVSQEIEGARVTAIENGVVKLEFDGQEIVLRLR